jgi:predicted outer membrane repeat protein
MLCCASYGSSLTNCIFSSNSARGSGGGMYSCQGSPKLTNCVFSANSATNEGGGVYNWYGDLTLTNCTFCGNLANSGGGIYEDDDASGGNGAIITNSIFWANKDSSGEDEYAQGVGYDMVFINYSCVQGWSGTLGGIGNTGSDPCFMELGYWEPNTIPDYNDGYWMRHIQWVDGDYHLLLDSPCVDTGDNTAVPPSVLTDLDGKPRIIGDTVDMGAYEFWGPIFVDDDGPNDPAPGIPSISDLLENGTEAHPFDTIQEAIDLSVDWYTVLVRQGSYFEPSGGSTVDFLGKNITLKSEDPTDWDVVDNTIVMGYVQFSGTEDPNCTFAGFKIRNLEGAVYGNHTHATISHCNISGNGPCGATVINDCDGTISNCLITDNLTFFYCGVYPVVFGCNGLIKNCTIANNISGVSVGTATIKNCIIYNNAGSQLDVGGSETLNISYCNLQGGLEGITGAGSVNRGPGNIDTDPCFVRAGYWEGNPLELIEGDYHLRSEGWYWNSDRNSWTYDYVTSRCIDAGNPGSQLDGELMSVPRDPDNTWGVNLRINMGAYGGTDQAGMPPHDWALLPDLNNDGIVNYFDFTYQTQDWQATAPEQPGDQNRDGVVNKMDLAALAEAWLQVTVWVE